MRGYLWPYKKFEASLGYKTPGQERNKNKNKSKIAYSVIPMLTEPLTRWPLVSGSCH